LSNIRFVVLRFLIIDLTARVVRQSLKGFRDEDAMKSVVAQACYL
jgi:hypothetical protein